MGIIDTYKKMFNKIDKMFDTQSKSPNQKIKKTNQPSKEEIEEIEEKIKIKRLNQLNSISEGDMSLIDQVPQNKISIILKRNEICYSVVEYLQFWEDRAVRKTSGGFGGFGFRVAKGVTFRVGKFGATGKTHMERKHIDTGTITLTNKRVVFVGARKNMDFALSKIISVEPFSNGFAISRSNKQKTEYFVGDFDGLIIKAMIEGAIRNL